MEFTNPSNFQLPTQILNTEENDHSAKKSWK